MLDWVGFLNEALIGCWDNVSLMAAIIIPVMVILEIARDLKFLERVGEWLAPALKVLGMSREAAPPMMVGLGFGITYGAGVIIEAARSGRLSWQDLFLLNVFLSICHAVVEDTLLFVAVGADGLAILGGRFLLAILVTFLISRSGWLARQAEMHSAKEMVQSMESGDHGHKCC